MSCCKVLYLLKFNKKVIRHNFSNIDKWLNQMGLTVLQLNIFLKYSNQFLQTYDDPINHRTLD